MKFSFVKFSLQSLLSCDLLKKIGMKNFGRISIPLNPQVFALVNLFSISVAEINIASTLGEFDAFYFHLRPTFQWYLLGATTSSYLRYSWTK